MKKSTFLYTLLLLAATSTFTSCKKDDAPEPGSGSSSTEIRTVVSMDAAEKVYFNLTSGKSVHKDSLTATNWDISFSAVNRSAALAVNSGTEGTGNAGAQLVQTGFDDLAEAPENGYKAGTEATPDFTTWANYTGSTSDPKHAVLPKAGLTLVVRTADGKYAKIQILSIYQGNPNTTTPAFADLSTRPAYGFFTFRYATQTSNSRKF